MDRPTKNLPEDVASIMPMKGHVFEGKYRVVNLIGAGGFARVFHARFEDVERDVALKVLLPQSGEPTRMYPEELVQRFLREARAVSDLRSPNTITLHDFGRTSRGLLYMVFEYVDGTPIDRLIKKEGALDPRRVLHIIRQVCVSLREAHAVGMLHRDVKPANVMVFDYLDQRDQVKVLDFGIAKTWTHDATGAPILEDLTEDGTVMGTPRYMSPEQIVGQRLTPQSDIYSLGLLTYEMLAGAPAAPQTQKTEVVRRHLGPEPFVLPQDVFVPAQLRRAVDRMLSKDISQRFHSVDEVLVELEQVAASDWSAEQLDMAETQATGAPVMMMAGAFGQPTGQTTPPGGAAPSSGGWVPDNTPPPTAAGTPMYSPQMPGAAAASQSFPPPTASGPQPGGTAIEKPQRTFIQVNATPTSFEVDVPLRPSKRALLICGATFVPFFIAFTVGGIMITFITAAGFVVGLSFVFTTYRLRITPQEGYELTTAVFTYERHKRGPAQSVVRFEARGNDGDDDTVLKLITHEGEFTVANAFSEAENQWVALEGNRWLDHQRAGNPNLTA